MSEIVARAFGEGSTGINQVTRVPDFTSVTYRIEMEHCLSSLIDCLGMCERILTTPVPRGYRWVDRSLGISGIAHCRAFLLVLTARLPSEMGTGAVGPTRCGLFVVSTLVPFPLWFRSSLATIVTGTVSSSFTCLVALCPQRSCWSIEMGAGTIFSCF